MPYLDAAASRSLGHRLAEAAYRPAAPHEDAASDSLFFVAAQIIESAEAQLSLEHGPVDDPRYVRQCVGPYRSGELNIVYDYGCRVRRLGIMLDACANHLETLSAA